MKKLFKYSLTAGLILSLGSCSDDFLEVHPTQFLTQEQVQQASANNPDVVAGSVAGIYTLMFETGTGGTSGHDDFGQKGYDIYMDMLSGDLALSQSAYGWYRADIAEFQATQDYTRDSNYKPWRYYYRIIRSANLVIDALGGNDVVPELDENKHLMGQAKALRAYAYFYLTQLFVESYDPAKEILPVYTDPTQPNQPKSTTQVVFDLMIKDLTEAITLMETFNRTQKSQINKYVAKGLLAYVYGAMDGNENAVKAKDLAFDIINNGGFTPLMSADAVAFNGTGDLVGGFNDVRTPSWMWGVDLTLDNGLDLVSWWGQMDAYTYSYQWAGDRKTIDKGLYELIPATDARKIQFWPTTTSAYYLTPRNKFYHPGRVIGGQRTIETDYVYMRAEEMYLLHAETAARSGDEGAARTSLKALLNLRLPSTTYIDGLSGQALKNEIYLQTRIELWGEGKSYLAMKRNKATITRGSNHLSNVGIPIPYNDNRLTLEIPQSEIQNNPFID